MLIIFLIGILAVTGCGKQKKDNSMASAIAIFAAGSSNSVANASTGTGTATGTGTGTASAEIPTFGPVAGTYTSDQTIAISTTTAGATIYYTIDGSAPSTSSTQYTGTISLAGNGTAKTIKAIAIKLGMTNSSTGSAAYTINYTAVATPAFSPVAGYYSTAQNISLNTTTSGANIYYTTDGTAPTTSSTVYSAAVHIWSLAGKTVKAFATKVGFADSAMLSGIFSYPPLKSGQTICYDATGATGNVVACAGTKEDGESQNGATRGYTGPTAHATYTSDYTTTDTATGLVWKTCSQGLSGATCATGSAVTLTLANASADATNGCNVLNSANSNNGYAGLKTWRVPTRQEMETLPDYSVSSPAINTTAFPATVATDVYWSSTTYAISISNAWAVLVGGDVSYTSKTGIHYVRCVSGMVKDFTLSFTDNGDGTVKDNTTSLIWQKCSRGQTNNSTCSGAATFTDWAGAITYCNGLSLAGKTWRLPQVNELKTIVDTIKTANPVIDTTAFPSTVANIYWSSTTYLATPANVWYITFGNGSVNNGVKTNSGYVRCVTGPQFSTMHITEFYHGINIYKNRKKITYE